MEPVGHHVGDQLVERKCSLAAGPVQPMTVLGSSREDPRLGLVRQLGHLLLRVAERQAEPWETMTTPPAPDFHACAESPAGESMPKPRCHDAVRVVGRMPGGPRSGMTQYLGSEASTSLTVTATVPAGWRAPPAPVGVRDPRLRSTVDHAGLTPASAEGGLGTRCPRARSNSARHSGRARRQTGERALLPRCNAQSAKQVPGRPKMDKLDAVWLAKQNERGMLRPSFIPPIEIRQLRDFTRPMTATGRKSASRSCSKTR